MGAKIFIHSLATICPTLYCASSVHTTCRVCRDHRHVLSVRYQVEFYIYEYMYEYEYEYLDLVKKDLHAHGAVQ